MRVRRYLFFCEVILHSRLESLANSLLGDGVEVGSHQDGINYRDKSFFLVLGDCRFVSWSCIGYEAGYGRDMMAANACVRLYTLQWTASVVIQRGAAELQ